MQKSKNNLKTVAAIAVLALFSIKEGMSLAQSVDMSSKSTESAVESSFSVEQKADLARKDKTGKFFSRLKAEIGASEDDLIDINRKIEDTKDKIEDKQQKINTLKGQLENLDRQINQTQQLIENVEVQISLKQAEIDDLEYSLEKKEIEISYQKQLIEEFLKGIYKDQADFNNIDQDGAHLNTLKLLLTNENTGENLRSLRYSEILEKQGREIFEKLQNLIEAEQDDRQILKVKQLALESLHEKLAAEKAELNIVKEAKQVLMDQTKGEEEIYQKLLSRSKAEQEDVLLEIETLRKNMAYVQDKIKLLGSDFNPDDYAGLFNVNIRKNLSEYLINSGEGEFAPIWPVNPGRGVSAYYREASYAKLFGMQHNAIDIRAYQNTPIKAAADGVIYKAKDNGYGYSYIMIAHQDGFMTLYGHVTEILVTEGEEVKVGDIIGLSGATPGTRGAGLYTTGPHLHFEILHDGTHVDPLEHLNLAFLRFDQLPEKYVSKALGDRKKVRRMPEKVKVRNNSQVVKTPVES